MTALAIPQPEYRALLVFEQIPEGCFAFPCTDEYSLPHIRPGEWVLVDTRDTLPRHGEAYVIQWNSGRRQICQAHRRQNRSAAPATYHWSVGALANPVGRASVDAAVNAYISGEATMQQLGWSEGPFADDDRHLRSKLVGVVIGLYAASLEPQL